MPRLVAAAFLVLMSLPPNARAQSQAPRIVLFRAEPPDALGEALLLALQLAFPEADVAPVRLGHPVGQPAAATVSVDRTPTGFRVRVEETGSGIAVERAIAAEPGGEEAAAHTMALLARSLLGIALLYEPERTAASAPLKTIATDVVRRASRVIAPPEPPTPPVEERPRPPAERPPPPPPPPPASGEAPPLLVTLAGAIQGPPPPLDYARFGGRMGLAYRFSSSPVELALDTALLTSHDVDERDAYEVSYTGTPIAVWVRWRVQRGPVEVAPGLGGSFERSFVLARIEGMGTREFADWNGSVGAELRLRHRILRPIFVDLGLRVLSNLTRQNYFFEDRRVLSVPTLGWGADLGVSAALP